MAQPVTSSTSDGMVDSFQFPNINSASLTPTRMVYFIDKISSYKENSRNNRRHHGRELPLLDEDTRVFIASGTNTNVVPRRIIECTSDRSHIPQNIEEEQELCEH